MTEKKTKKSSPPTVITLTLSAQDEEARSGTLVIARGDLAHIHQFSYSTLGDLTQIIKDGFVALAHVEADPPKEAAIPAPAARSGTKADAKLKDAEPTVEVPLKKGTMAVKVSDLKIVGGESDAAAYRQAVLIAGRLIDGKLWDGKSPIRIDDVGAVQGKLQHLTDRDLSMFALSDFVQAGEANTASDMTPNAQEDTADEPDAAVVRNPSDQASLI